MMNRAAFIEKLIEVQQTVGQLLAQLEATSATRLPATSTNHRQFRHASERPGKGNKAIERAVLSSYQVAQSLGFDGDYRAWEHLLRIHN